MSSAQNNNIINPNDNSSGMNDIPQELLSNLLENLNNTAEEQLNEANKSDNMTESEVDEATESEVDDATESEDDDNDYDYIDNLEDDFDLNLMDEISYKDILSQFFETKNGDNLADVLSDIKHSIDQNSKCIMKLCKIIETFNPLKDVSQKKQSPRNKSSAS